MAAAPVAAEPADAQAPSGVAEGAESPVEGRGPRVTLERFEGPLDLLLYLVREDELDIGDIPIARITEQYLLMIDDLANRTGMDKKDVKNFLLQLTSLIEDEIKKGGEVPMKGLGKFRVQNRKARVGRNPLTGAEIQIPAKTVVKFSISKTLKDLA